MGIVYCGPYADLVGYQHEGYAARVMPDGALSASWGGDVPDDVHVGLRAACDCGWIGDTLHPGGDYESPGYLAAEDEWRRTHLQPLIDKAAATWVPWAETVARLAREAASHVRSGRTTEAVRALEALAGEVRARRRIAEQLADEVDTDTDGV